MSDFLPENYEPPKMGGFIKIKQGEQKALRILGKFADPKTAVIGWEGWKDRKHFRQPYTDLGKVKVEQFDERGQARHFWAVIVWDVDAKEINTWIITQRQIQDAITVLVRNPSWGDPANYVLKVGRTGSGLEDTRYSVIPEPPVQPPENYILEMLKDSKLDLQNQVFSKDETETETDDDIPF